METLDKPYALRYLPDCGAVPCHLISHATLSSFCGTTWPSELPLILPAHLDTISRALASLPEASAALANQGVVADTAVLRPVVGLPRAPPTYHAVCPLVGVLLGTVMTLIASVHLLAAAEPEPPVALRVVAAPPALGEFCAGRETKRLLLAGRAAGRREPVEGGDAQEFELRDRECEFLMAFAAHVPGRLAADGDDPR
jgi:hypothetical protein